MSLWVIFMLSGNLYAQKTEQDFFEKIATIKTGNNPRKNELIPSPPKVLPDIKVESKINNKAARIGKWNPLDTKKEFDDELNRLRQDYVKYLQDFTPAQEVTRKRMYLTEFEHRLQTKADELDFTNVLKGNGAWEKVSIPHYGAPVGHKTTFYRTVFNLSSDMLKYKRKVIYFKGIDYEARVYINGRCIGDHIGFFEPFEFDITPFVKHKGNVLVVEVVNHVSTVGFDIKRRRLVGNKIYAVGGLGWDNPGFGWHACPPGMGIYQDVFIEGKPGIAIADIFVRPDIDKKEIELNIGIYNYDLNSYRLPELKFAIYSKNFKGFAIENRAIDTKGSHSGPGYNTYKIRVPFPEFRLWNTDTPWLYNMVVQLESDDDKDIQQAHFGMRKFHEDTLNVPKGKLYLNNKEIYLRGANTMGHLQRAVYDKDEQQLIDDILIAKMTNMNFFRLTQRPVQGEIYAMCDRLGMLLQTDLPLFAFLPVEVVHEAINQAGAMEKLVRNHPSNIMVTFENEPHNPNTFGVGSRSMSRIEKEHFFRAAAEVVHIHNPDRVIKPIDGDYDPPTPFGRPDYHMYNGWYGDHGIPLGKLHKGYWIDTKKDWLSGCGEHGVEGLEALETMFKYYPKQWLPEEKKANAPWHPGKINISSVMVKTGSMKDITQHTKDVAQQTSERYHYWYDKQETIGQWIEASQNHQAFVTRLVTRAFRRQSDRINSNAIHLLIDAWPSGWQKTIIDVDRIPKKAWYEYRDALSPLLTDIRTDRSHYFESENLNLEFWIANDKRSNNKSVELVWEVHHRGKLIFANKKLMRMPDMGPTFVGYFDYKLPQVTKREKMKVRLALHEQGAVIHCSEIEIDVFPKIKAKREVLVFKEDTASQKLLDQLALTPVFIEHYTHNKPLPIITSHHKWTNASVVKEWGSQGATVLLTKQQDTQFRVFDAQIKISPVGGETNFISLNTGHPLVEKYEPFDFSYWHNKERGYISHSLSSIGSDAKSKPVLNVFDSRPVVIQMNVGKGKVYICQLDIQNFIGHQPTMHEFLTDILK